MLTTELDRIDERFAEIVADLDPAWAVNAKLRPIGHDEDDVSTRDEDLEPWDDEDMPDDDVEWP